MLHTTSSQHKILDKITHLIQALQESEMTNKKMGEAFSNSLQAQTKLQNKVHQLQKEKQISIPTTDSVFANLQSKLDSKIDVMSKKTAAAMDLFHQKLEAHKASTITSKKTTLTPASPKAKNTTQLIASAMTGKPKNLHSNRERSWNPYP